MERSLADSAGNSAESGANIVSRKQLNANFTTETARMSYKEEEGTFRQAGLSKPCDMSGTDVAGNAWVGDNKNRLRIDSPVFTPRTAGTLTGPSTSPTPNNASSYHVAGHSPLRSDALNRSVFSNPESGIALGCLDSSMEDHIVRAILSEVNIGVEFEAVKDEGDYGTLGPTYFQSPNAIHSTVPSQPLQYHLYNSPLPHVAVPSSHHQSVHAFFINDRLREELQRKSEAVQQVFDPTESQAIPTELHHYHSLVPVESSQDSKHKVFGFASANYKAFSWMDGKAYILRRIAGYRLANEEAISAIEPWHRLRHSAIVSVREAFTTKAFGDDSLIFVYDYHPLSVTLQEKYLETQASPPAVSEKILWSFLIQMLSALKAIHAAGLAARVIEPSKIIVTGKHRIRLNCCGIVDVLSYDSGKSLPQQQQDDLLQLGQMTLALACGSLSAVHNLAKSVDYVVRHFSADMKNVVYYLLSKPTPYKTVDDVITMIGPRILQEINFAHQQNDFLESELCRELENGRLVRLLCKLGFINERPEFDMNPTWAETGDRYLLKLFRDYVFHQVEESGSPVIDLAHAIQCLNKVSIIILELDSIPRVWPLTFLPVAGRWR
ncbi:hypothetical protein DFS34DRAFT_645550 [Phlyctochytrium arcticum]|nr:hypothetical protein DFS34DRAFT_645550 [Phlyctochytrium arcticum]